MDALVAAARAAGLKVVQMAEALALGGYGTVQVVVEAGSEGLPEDAFFAAILATAAHPQVPDPLGEQLAGRERLVQPMGSRGAREVVLFEKLGRELCALRSASGAHFARLHGLP
jgi:protein-L-isoaspartate(D-aspartate) O-methyltransferase